MAQFYLSTEMQKGKKKKVNNNNKNKIKATRGFDLGPVICQKRMDDNRFCFYKCILHTHIQDSGMRTSVAGTLLAFFL